MNKVETDASLPHTWKVFPPTSDQVTKRCFKLKSRPQLSDLERARIVHSCLLEQKSLKEVSEQEQTRYLTVQKLVKQARVNPSFLQERREKEE